MNTRKNAEALRMSVGLTLRDDSVTVIFMDDGVYSATPLRPEVINFAPLNREFEALSLLKCRLLADKTSLEKRGVKNLLPSVSTADRDEIVRMITQSDIVIPF